MYKIEKEEGREASKNLHILCLFVCFLFVSNKRKNAQTDRAQICVGPHMTGPGNIYS